VKPQTEAERKIEKIKAKKELDRARNAKRNECLQAFRI
jgi:hypothetical protein